MGFFKNFLAAGLIANSQGMKDWEQTALFLAMNDYDRQKAKAAERDFRSQESSEKKPSSDD